MVNGSCKDSFKRFTDEPDLVCSPSPEDDNGEKEKQEVKNLAEPTAKCQTRITPCLKNYKVIQKEIIFHSNKTPQVSSVFAITSNCSVILSPRILSHNWAVLSTLILLVLRKLFQSQENLRIHPGVIVRMFLPSYDDFLSINGPCDDSVIFYNPLFGFNDEYVSSDVNHLFDEMLEERVQDSYYFQL
ncbi:hypothetical protein Tco_0556943 [Tanacetum coccineum]